MTEPNSRLNLTKSDNLEIAKPRNNDSYERRNYSSITHLLNS